MREGKSLYMGLLERGLLEYGQFIPLALVQQLLDIEQPAQASREVFEALALRELGAIDYVREMLLCEGKYIKKSMGGYRVLLPSENAEQSSSYEKQANRKLIRAEKLLRTTPKVVDGVVDHSPARIFLKKMSRRESTIQPMAA